MSHLQAEKGIMLHMLTSVVCVLVKICVSSISLYKLDTDKLTAPFESAHQFTLVCTVSDSKTVPGCHYNL